MLPVIDPNFFCSLASSAAREQLFGTASRGEVWFLLEYREHWEADSFAASALPAPVKERLAGYLKTVPGSRLHFIKHYHYQDDDLTLFVALTGEIGPALYRFSLSGYEDLLSIDVAALVQNSTLFEGYVTHSPVYLTCTHGRHDKCCAKYGRPVVKTLETLVGPDAWQVSHLGGDRFAANMVCFPHGLYYGRVEPEEVETIVSHYRQGKVYLEKCGVAPATTP